MFRLVAVFIFAISCAACDMVRGTLDLVKHSNDVKTDIEQSTGIKPEVGVNWHNGRLRSVTVQFPDLYDRKPLRELAEEVNSVVIKRFNQKPDSVILSFSVKPAAQTAAARSESRLSGLSGL